MALKKPSREASNARKNARRCPPLDAFTRRRREIGNMQFKLIDNYLVSLRSSFSHKTNLIGFSVLLAAIVFLCLACDNAERTTNIVTAPEDAAEQLPPGEGLDVGALAPEFTLPDSDGKSRSLSEYRGQKLVIVFYRTGT